MKTVLILQPLWIGSLFLRSKSWSRAASIFAEIVFFPIVLNKIKKGRVPLVSIVIPCYNQAHFLQETLSNLEPSSSVYEVIIINDGSTSKDSSAHFEMISKLGFNVIHQKNAGLAAARNAGIELAKGEFVFLLDADNMIEPNFIDAALNVFANDKSVSVIYGDASYFGNKEGDWIVGDFNLQKLMLANYIDACAIVRKDVFEKLGGYDVTLNKIKSGWEDWEMWLRISFNGGKFKYLPIKSFRYRVAEQSMITEVANNYKARNMLLDYLHKKYPNQLGHGEVIQYVSKRFKPKPFKFIAKLAMYTWSRKRYDRLLQENKIIKGI